MKHRFLLLSFFFFISFFLEKYLRIIFIVLIVIYWFKRYQDKTTILITLLLLSSFFLEIRIKPQLQDYYTVEKINQNSLILKDKYQRLYQTSKFNLNYDDKIIITKGDIEELKEDSFFYSYSSKDYQNSNFVFYNINIDSYKLISEGNTLRNKIYKRILTFDQDLASFYKRIIFHFDDNYLDYSANLNTYLYSTSLYLVTLITLIRKNLPQVTKYLPIVLFIYGLKTHFTCAIFRLILSLLLTKVEDKSDRLGLLIISLLFINPSFRFSLAFIYPISFSLISLFKNKSKLLSTQLALIPINLYFTSVYKPLNAILFFSFKYLFCLIYLIGLFCLLINNYYFIRLIIPSINYFDVLPDIKITGKPLIIFIIIYYYFYVKYLKDKKYLLLLVLLLFLNQNQNLFKPYSSIHFLNVNHGDCIIYQPRFSNSVLMIDTASSYNYYRVQKYLDSLGIKIINTLVITHLDDDHCANIKDLNNDYHLINLYLSKEKEIKYKDITLFGLLSDIEYENINTNSAIYLTKIANLNYLFLADATFESERDLVKYYPNLKIDIMKIAHHGSSSSTSNTLLDNINCQLGIISCGDFEIFHHPSYEVLQRLSKYHIPYLTTNQNGDIKIISIFNLNFLITSKGEYAIIKGQNELLSLW